jgi:hypothetical protein
VNECPFPLFYINIEIDNNSFAECINECPQRTYALNRTCRNCYSDCIKCTGPKINDCLICDEKKVIYKNQCYNECPPKTIINRKRECEDCKINCK